MRATDHPARRPRPAPAWRTRLALLLPGAVALGFGFLPVLAELWQLWTATRTWSYAALVPPVALWLLFERRRALAGVVPAWSLLGGQALVFAVGLLALGRLLEIQVLAQLALVGALLGWCWLVLGDRFMAVAALPAVYLFLAVPNGDFLIGPLQALTAALALPIVAHSGVPAVIDGYLVAVPAGWFEIAPECSGIGFLLASLVTAVPFLADAPIPALRKLLLGALLVLAAIPLNALRVASIILLPDLSGGRIDVSADHLAYGWVVFVGANLALMLAIRPWLRPALHPA